MIKHIVFFKLKEKNKSENINKLIEALCGLKNKIDVIQNLEVGKNFSVKPSAYDISLIVDMKNKEDLELYRVHPEHKKVVDIIIQINEKSAVVDYEF